MQLFPLILHNSALVYPFNEILNNDRSRTNRSSSRLKTPCVAYDAAMLPLLSSVMTRFPQQDALDMNVYLRIAAQRYRLSCHLAATSPTPCTPAEPAPTPCAGE